jgi:hypothetical protein
MKSTPSYGFHLAGMIFAALTVSASASITLYLSGNDVQSAETSGFASGITFQTESFDTHALGSVNGYNSTVGTYICVSGGNVQAHDQYGGNGDNNYLGIASGTTTTLTLAEPVAYFGIYFTAGDARNSFEIKSGGVTLLTFNTAELIKLLPNTDAGRITAIDGQVYKTKDYYGQPVTGLNPKEPYGYIHIVGTEGTTFNQVLLSQAAGGAIFESDNHSIRVDAPTLPGTLVNVTSAIPEPSTGWLSAACLGLMALRRKRA